MCFHALVNGDGIDRPLAAVRAEFPAALRTGLLAAAFVVVAALADGTPLVVGQLPLLALLAGTGAHLAVLLAGVGVLRLRLRLRAAGGGTAAAG